MTSPLWFWAIWAAEAFCSLLVCSTVVRTSSLKEWPSLFVICANRAAFFAVALCLQHSYHAYFYIFWIDSALLDVCLIWFAWDVYRAMPSSRLFPRKFQIVTANAVMAVGFAVALLTVPNSTMPLITFVLRLSRAADITLSAMASCALLSIGVAGYGFRLTGFRVMAGQLSGQICFLCVSQFLNESHTRAAARAASVAETLCVLCVAVYWNHALLLRSADLKREHQEWAPLSQPASLGREY